MQSLANRARRFTNSLVFRIVAIGALILTAGTLGRVAYVTTVLRDSIQGVVTSHLQAMAHQVARDLDAKLLDRQQRLQALADSLSAQGVQTPRALPSALAQHPDLRAVFTAGLVVIPLNGQGGEASLSASARLADRDFSQNGWFRAVRQGEGSSVGLLLADGPQSAAGEGAVVVAVPVKTPNGLTVAVLAGATAVDTPGFLSAVQGQGVGESGGFLLVSPQDGLLVAATDPALRLRQVAAPGLNPLHDQAMAGWQGTGITVNAQGVEELAAVTGVPLANWFVVARLPTAEAFEPVDTVRSFFFRVALVLLAGMVVVLVVILGFVFRPLKHAAHRMRQMADGDIPLAPLPVTRHDEVGEMVEGFNHLVVRLQESENRLSHLAHHDPLTGLPNRRALLDRLRQSVALAQRQGTRLALLFVDIDGFKPVNDRHGHDIGDLLLQHLAATLSQSVRQADVVARFGGDEFVVLLTDVAGRDSVAAVATKLIDTLSQPCQLREHTVAVGASVGIALYPADATDADHLMSKADQAMYEVKRSGRQAFRFAAA